MSRPILYIGNNIVDIDPKTNIGLTISINEIAELKDRDAIGTNKFRAAYTEKNNAIFGYIKQVQSAGKIHQNRIPARLELEGNTYFGYVILDNTDGFYNLTFYGGNAEFFEPIKDKRLKDADFSQYDLTWNFVDMFFNYGSQSSPTFLVVDDGNLPALSRTVDIRKQFPSLYIKDIISTILTENKFTGTGSMFDDERYNKLYIPFTNETPKRDDAFKVKAYILSDQVFYMTQGVDKIIEFDDDGAVTGEDLSNQWTINPGSSSYYEPTATNDVDFDILVRINCLFIDSTGAQGQTALRVELIKESPTGTTVIKLLGSFVKNNQNTFQDLSYKQHHHVEAGEKYKIRLSLFGSTNSKITIRQGVINRTHFFVTKDDVLPFGELWEWKFNLPDMSQTDFLKAIFQMLGVTVETDGLNRELRCEIFPTIIANKANAPNIDSMIDNKVQEKIDLHPRAYAQKNWMRYSNDDNVEKYYGDGFFTIGDNTLIPEKEILSLPFAASEETSKLNGCKMAEVLRILNGNAVTPEPRILMAAYDDPAPLGGDITFTDGTTTDTSPVLNHGYFKQSGELNIDWPSLIASYYPHHVSLLNNYMACTLGIAFTPNFINSLDLFTPVFSHKYNSYFLIDKINSYQSGVTASVELIKLI